MKKIIPLFLILILLTVAFILAIFLSTDSDSNFSSATNKSNLDENKYVRIENSGYYKKGSEIFYSFTGDAKLMNADPNTFIPIGLDTAKDSKHVWINNVIQEGIDPESFNTYSYEFLTRMYVHFYSDKNGIYYVANDKEKGLTLKPSPFDPRNAEVVGKYLKTPNGIYLPGYDTLTKIDGIDNETFRILGSCAVVEMSSVNYMIDKNHIYVGTDIIEEADPETFKLFATTNAQPGDEVPYSLSIWKDAKNFYAPCGKVIKEADYSTFEYIGNNTAQDKNNTYFFTTGGGYQIKAIE